MNLPRCPVCQCVRWVKAWKAYDGKTWWSRCHAGDARHGDVVFFSGETVPWPDPVYFTDDGRADTGRGVMRIARQARQAPSGLREEGKSGEGGGSTQPKLG